MTNIVNNELVDFSCPTYSLDLMGGYIVIREHRGRTLLATSFYSKLTFHCTMGEIFPYCHIFIVWLTSFGFIFKIIYNRVIDPSVQELHIASHVQLILQTT